VDGRAGARVLQGLRAGEKKAASDEVTRDGKKQ
jgi:hypothetical protein